MYICGVPKWEVTLQKKIDRRNVEVLIVEDILLKNNIEKYI